MIILKGKYKGSQPKRNGKGYLIGVEGDGFRTNVVHVKNDDIANFKDIKKEKYLYIHLALKIVATYSIHIIKAFRYLKPFNMAVVV